MKFQSAGFSHIGHYRDTNEDKFLNLDVHGLYAVADGLGGVPGGGIASDSVITSLQQFFEKNASTFHPSQDAWQSLWADLNQTLIQRAQTEGFPHPIGTTLSILHLQGHTAWWSHMGDTRIYRTRSGHTKCLTTDHTLLELQRTNPDDPELQGIEENKLRNTLTRCMGTEEDLKIDIRSDTILSGDRYLICSDGVWTSLDAVWLNNILNSTKNPETIVLEIEQESLLQGGHDNLTAVVVFATKATETA